MATSLEKLENKVQIHHLHVERFHMVKRLRKSVQYVRRYSTKCDSFLAVSYLTFTNKPCQLWSYWTEFDEILTLFRGISYAVNAHIEIARAHSVSEWQSDKCRGVGNFASFLPLNWLPWQRPLRNRKNWTISRKFTQIPSVWEKIVKIGPVDTEIALLILKKQRKKEETRNAWQSLAYSPLGAVVSPPSKYLWKTLTYWSPPPTKRTWSHRKKNSTPTVQRKQNI